MKKMIIISFFIFSMLFSKELMFNTHQAFSTKSVHSLNKNANIHNCHSIMNCANSCPKGLNPAKAIVDLKKQIATNI